ncbi:hypothetical protein Cgig2_008642 [Carnegiea gigantea]|uniref:Uncharacterized protein n=1 Tax=Carnegiea gigantea TaxID=171969 RepID=A0A9Q1JGQ9_9CARY|nr:hypothetical protein Cgig2_008642 [Carnegiea gigantea]
MKKDCSMPSNSLGSGLNPSTVAVNEDDGIEDDDDGAPLRFTFRNTSQVNRVLSVKKPAKKKPIEGDEPASKKGEPVEQNKGNPRDFSEQVATDSRKPKLIKKLLHEKHDKKHLGAARTPEKLEKIAPLDALKTRQPENLPLAYCSPYVFRLTKLNSELCQDELTISEYVFSKVEDVDDSEPLFDGCDDKEAIRASMLEMNVINIWSSILNDRERKTGSHHSKRIFHVMRTKCTCLTLSLLLNNNCISDYN